MDNPMLHTKPQEQRKYAYDDNSRVGGDRHRNDYLQIAFRALDADTPERPNKVSLTRLFSPRTVLIFTISRFYRRLGAGIWMAGSIFHRHRYAAAASTGDAQKRLGQTANSPDDPQSAG